MHKDTAYHMGAATGICKVLSITVFVLEQGVRFVQYVKKNNTPALLLFMCLCVVSPSPDNLKHFCGAQHDNGRKSIAYNHK